MTASLRILSSKADLNTWESFTRSELKLSQCIKSHHAQTSSGKGLPSHFWNRNIVRSISPGLRRKITGTVAQWSKVLFSNESQFCISFGNQGPRVWRKRGEAQNPCCLKSSVKFPQSVMFWVPCHLLVLVHCVFWSPQSTQPSTSTFWSTSCFLLLTSFIEIH